MSVNVGILGFAHGHVMGYGGNWAKYPEMGVNVKKGWDTDAGRAENGAKALNAQKAEKIEEILDDSDIQAVVISSETKYHVELVERAAEAGKKIILYKPMALTLEGADRIVAAVEKYDVPMTMGWQMRTDPQNIKIKQLIKDKTIGDAYAYRRRHALSTHLSPDFCKTWHAAPELNRDIFADDASHPIDMLNWIFGVPETVMAELSTMHTPNVPNDTGVALFKYKNGMIAEISAYFSCSASEITTEVYGAKGAIQQYYGDGPSTRLPRPAGQPGLKWFVEGESDWTSSEIPSPKGHGERISGQAQPLADFLQGKRPPICGAREGRDSLRMLLACYVSSKTGERVSIDDARIYDV
ncbi:MAG: Gfo/Idh/MocA family oxidoreductase [Oscillospiraceae bacterium]|nr:Gfo/Idh/MocA family oxidoreductase [Oscillospiraceae bacterium]